MGAVAAAITKVVILANTGTTARTAAIGAVLSNMAAARDVTPRARVRAHARAWTCIAGCGSIDSNCGDVSNVSRCRCRH